MRTILLSIILSIFAVSQMNAQECDAVVTDFGNNQSIASYNVNGDVDLVYNSDNNTITLNLGENYSTAFGPDVRAYLVNSNGLTDAQLSNTRIADLENVEFGLTEPSGAASFTIDAPENVENFDKVFFYCLQFDQFWDFGSFVPFAESECFATTSVFDDVFNREIKIFPNPASDRITVFRSDLGGAEGQIIIYNMLGGKMMQVNGDLNQEIEVSNLIAGVYLLGINSEGKTATRKLVIR